MMKLTREDFRLYDASYYDDWAQVWIQKRHFEKKYWLFGELIPTDRFDLVMFGCEPLEFNNVDEAEDWIRGLINGGNE